MNLSDLVLRNAAFAPDKAAIRFAGAALSYAAFASRIQAAARGLGEGLGVERGDRVAILSTNHPDYLVALYACARIGAILVPLNWRLAPAEHAFIIGDAGAKALIVEAAFANVLEALASNAPLFPPPSPRGGRVEQDRTVRAIGIGFEPAGGITFEALVAGGGCSGRDPIGADVTTADPVLIVYTSGTTGRPKGAVLTQDALIANAVMSQHMHDMTSDDVVLTVLPMFHVGGLNIQTTPALQVGATVVIHERFAPGPALAAIEAERATLMVMVPSTMQAIIEHPAWTSTRLTSLRSISAGSTLVPQPLIDRFAERGVAVLQVYGSTETSPIAIYSRIGCDWRRPGSTGLPGLLCEARVVDDAGREVALGIAGEVEVRGPNVMREYWGNARATAKTLHDGWCRSGDIGTRDGDGYFFIRDRRKNMIISGGENIYPAEVERVLLSHPAIAEAAVVGEPDPRWQEVPVGCVVLRPGMAATAEEIEAFCLIQLARFKVPRRYRFLSALPRNAMGKVQHFALKKPV